MERFRRNLLRTFRSDVRKVRAHRFAPCSLSTLDYNQIIVGLDPTVVSPAAKSTSDRET